MSWFKKADNTEHVDYMSTDDVDASPESTREKGNYDNQEIVRFQTESAEKIEANDEVKKKLNIDGIAIDIEWPKGSTRSYKNSDFHVPMHCHYGYIRSTEGEDGEEWDIYVNSEQPSELVFKAEQLKDDGGFDEYKFILGCNSEEEARKLFEQHMQADKIGKFEKLSWNDFKKLVKKEQKESEKSEPSQESDMKNSEEKQRRLSILKEAVQGIKLTTDQKQLYSTIEDNIMLYRPEFLERIGQHFTFSWDPGSSWEVVEADGKSKLKRKQVESDYDSESFSKHKYKLGQCLQVDNGVVPEDVIVRECLINGGYKVQSEITGRTFSASEVDLIDENEGAGLFDGEIDLGKLSWY